MTIKARFRGWRRAEPEFQTRVVASIRRNTSSAGAMTSGPMPSPASTAIGADPK
jgi:hypothetical protein